MKFSIVSGSSRPNSQSLKVASYIQTILEKKFNRETYLLDLAQNHFPYFEVDLWEDKSVWHKNWANVSSELESATALVVVTPEWDGMVPPALKNFFNLCCHGELYHKPALIVSVSAGDGGSYPVAELRMSSYKNTKLCYLPEHLIIRKVEEVLNFSEKEIRGEEDERLQETIYYHLAMLDSYALAFTTIHSSGILDREKYPYGF